MASRNVSTRSANLEPGAGANARLSAAVSGYGAGMEPTVLPEQWSLVEQWHMERREPVEVRTPWGVRPGVGLDPGVVSGYGAGMEPTVLPEQWSLVEQWHMERREPVEVPHGPAGAVVFSGTVAHGEAGTRGGAYPRGVGLDLGVGLDPGVVRGYGAGMEPTVLPEQWSLVEQWHMERREPVEPPPAKPGRGYVCGTERPPVASRSGSRLWRSSVSNQLSNLKNRLTKSLHDFPRKIAGPKRYEKPSPEDADRSSEPLGEDRGASGEVGEPSATSEDDQRLSDKKSKG
ncbi:hypothetical protein Bbelb_221840 [Branchiostoma belcheri]|nr:hypothetical protein Bbelb_221840 [Branchiostoma belcheri]